MAPREAKPEHPNADNPLMREERVAFRRSLRSNLTLAEVPLWERLRRRQLCGYKFRRQHPVGRYVLDFYCVEQRLAVEVDGESHFAGSGPARDRRRDEFLAGLRIRVLRFTNPEVMGEMDGVVEVIIQGLQAPPPSLPRARTRGGGVRR